MCHIDSKTCRWKGQLSAWGSSRRKDGRLGARERDGSDSVGSREDGPRGKTAPGNNVGQKLRPWPSSQGRTGVAQRKGPDALGVGAGEGSDCEGRAGGLSLEGRTDRATLVSVPAWDSRSRVHGGDQKMDRSPSKQREERKSAGAGGQGGGL